MEVRLATLLLAEGCATLRRLGRIRGRSRRTARRIGQAAAAVALACGLLGMAPFATPAQAAAEPMFGAAATNPFGLSDTGQWTNPALVDLDDDGDLDAMIGGYIGGSPQNWHYFENTGSAAAPAFAAPVGNPFGLTNGFSAAAPAFADLDGDGDVDFLIGGDAGLRYYENTGSAAAPAFAASVASPFGLPNVSLGTRPELVDIDADGDVDLFVGNSGGGLGGDILFFENTGSAVAPAFAAAQTNPFGLTNLGAAQSPAPAFADADGDGDADAWIALFDGTTSYFENTGSATAPAFAAPVTNPFGLTDVGTRATPELADIDADGDLDAFFGTDAGDIVFFQNDCPPPTPTPTGTATATVTPSATASSSATATATATPQPNGAACGTPSECASTYCVDSVCCDQPCDGPAEQCNLSGQAGHCATAAAPAPAATPFGLLVGLASLLGIAARRLWPRRAS